MLRETFRRLIDCKVHVRSLTERDVMSLALTPSSTPTSALCEEDVNDVIAELGLPNTRRRHRQICDMLGGGGGEPAVKKARRDSLQARDPSVFCAEYSDDSDTESYDDTAPPQPPSPSPQTIGATAERRSEQPARASLLNLQRLKRALETVTVDVAPDDDHLDSMTDLPDFDCQIIGYDAAPQSKPVNREPVIKQEPNESCDDCDIDDLPSYLDTSASESQQSVKRGSESRQLLQSASELVQSVSVSIASASTHETHEQPVETVSANCTDVTPSTTQQVATGTTTPALPEASRTAVSTCSEEAHAALLQRLRWVNPCGLIKISCVL